MSDKFIDEKILRKPDNKIKAVEPDAVFDCIIADTDASADSLKITDIQKGAYCAYNNMDFGANDRVTGFRVKIKTDCRLVWMEIRLDNPDGPKIGLCQIAARDLGSEWGIAKTGVYGARGVHNVYLKFIDFCNCRLELEWFEFMTDLETCMLIKGKPLPVRVPYLGPLEKYFLGSGIVGGGGDTDGVWDYLIGPDYTFYGYIKSCESFIRREEIRLVTDHVEEPLNIEMRRARGTGMFYGIKKAGDLTVHLIEYTNNEADWVSRLLFVENNSADRAHDVSVKACVIPAGLSDSVVDGTAVEISHGCEESINKNVTMTFTDPSTIVSRQGNSYILETAASSISPKGKDGDRYITGLYHYAYRNERTARQCIDDIRRKSVKIMTEEVQKCVEQWAHWLSKGDSLDKVQDQKVKDAVESALVIMKMLQGRDGGIMATARNYMDSYVRDSAGCLRGLIAAGHTDEAEKFMLWVDHKYNVTGIIPCNADIGDDAAYFPGYGSKDNWSAENPALYLLTARNYFDRMREKGRENEAMKLFRSIDRSLRYAMDIQLESLINNHLKLYFNGDETESSGAGIRLLDPPYIEQYWSMPSLTLCAASLDFFIEYIKEKGVNPEDYLNSVTGQSMNLLQVLSNIKGSFDDNFWRTDLPESSQGFYDWYRSREGRWPECRITNYTLFPLFYEMPLNHPERAFKSAKAMKQYFNSRGFLPIQPGGANEDFCGHNLGYLLYALVEMKDPMMEGVFEALINGGTMGCWGTWSEAYTAGGETYMKPSGDSGYTTSNMRPFETGTNIDAIMKYLRYHDMLENL